MNLTRVETAAEAIRKEILSGRYLSGERLVELRIAQQLAVSQNTIRDALRILEQEGWVVKTPRLGVHVRQFSDAAAAEIGALIASVETLALTWAIPHLDRNARAQLRALIRVARQFAHEGDQRQAFDHLLRFHQQISTAAQKPLTEQVLETLYNQLRLLDALRQARAPRSDRELTARIDEHEALLKRIDAGEAEAACQQLRTLIDAYSAATVAALRLSST